MPTQRCGVADAITARTGLTRRGWYRIGILLFLLITLAFQGTMPSQQSAAASNAEWPLGGQNLANTRDQDEEATIGTGTVGGLAPTWVFTTGGNVSATPAVVAGAVYVPDWAGNLYKIDATTGSTIWSHRISDYDGVAGSVSRTSPAVVGNTIYIGDQNGAHLMAIDANTGNLIWIAQLDPHPYAIITQSPVVYNGVVYVGVSSTEEAAAANPNYACCTFRGSVVALDAGSGRILWQTYMVPANGGQPGGYSGGAVWSSTPVVDSARNSLYITTGNNYTVPASVATCENNGGGSACDTPENHFDSILSLDLTTGAIKWATGTQTFDAFTVACRRGPPANCPPPAGPDYDFGSGANLFTVTVNGQPQTMLGAGQKSGTYWALNPDTGQILWATAVGPGGVGGGIEWGTATDGQRIYVAIANSGRQPYTLIPSGQTVTGGAWSALDAATGSILWQTADPLQAQDSGAVSVANGVVYAGSMDSAGHMYALDASTGTILWSFASGGSVAAGAAIANGTVYWGSGYSRVSGTRSNNKIFAFGLNAATATPTTSSATITPTDTPTSTATPTDTPTDVATATPTDTPTNTPTTAATPTDSASATPTDTPSDVATATSTDSPTATPTDSPTATPTDSPTDAANAATDTPTDVATITPTDTPTTTPTNAATDTPTDTATSPAPSPTETAAPTNTPTDTPTDTPTATNSPTPTATNSPTVTATNSPTVTATNSPTATATSTAVAARLALNPLRVVPFQTLALTGTGFLSGQKVHVSLDSITSTALLTPTVGVGGAFTATLSVPQAISGTHTLLAVGLPQGPGAYAQLQVAPEVILSPSSGAAGSAATAIGFGFGRGETVRLYWDVPSTLLGTTSSSAVGSFYGGTGSTRQISFTVPSGAAAGRHYVVAVGQSSGARAYATFTVH